MPLSSLGQHADKDLLLLPRPSPENLKNPDQLNKDFHQFFVNHAKVSWVPPPTVLVGLLKERAALMKAAG